MPKKTGTIGLGVFGLPTTISNDGGGFTGDTGGGGGGFPVDINDFTYSQTITDIGTEFNIMRSMQFNDDGTKVFINDQGISAFIKELSLTVPGDLSGGYTLLNTLVLDPYSNVFVFSPDGLTFQTINGDTDLVLWTLTTAWDTTTATKTSSVSASSWAGGTDATMSFNDDGTKFYFSNRSSDETDEYNLSTPYVISTLGSIINTLSPAVTLLGSHTFSPDGTAIVYTDAIFEEDFVQYNLTTAWDLSSATLFATVDAGYDVVTGLFSLDGTKMYFNDVDETIYEYTTGN